MRHLLLLVLVLAFAEMAESAGQKGVLGVNGLGPARFGMKAEELIRALGTHSQVPEDPNDQGCYFIEAKQYPDVRFMIEGGTLRRIDTMSKRISTQSGLGIGSSIASLKRYFGAKLLDEPHHYTGPEGRYLTAPLSSTLSVRFEANEGRVDVFYVGYHAQSQYVEGCL